MTNIRDDEGDDNRKRLLNVDGVYMRCVACGRKLECNSQGDCCHKCPHKSRGHRRTSRQVKQDKGPDDFERTYDDRLREGFKMLQDDEILDDYPYDRDHDGPRVIDSW